MPSSVDDMGAASALVADSLDMLSREIKQHADSLRRDPRELRQALQVLCETADTPGSKFVITGVGKSFLIGKKLAATLTSVGTRAVSLHATEALHGDLGIIGPGDCVIALSYSGASEEVVRLVSVLHDARYRGTAPTDNTRVVGMGRSPDTPLGALCDAWISTPVDSELSPEVRAPTVSSSLMLAIGDSIAILLMNRRRFGPVDFARNHPGGSLGQSTRSITQQQPVKDPAIQTSTPPLSAFDD